MFRLWMGFMEDKGKFSLKNRLSNLISFRMNGKMTYHHQTWDKFFVFNLVTKLFQLLNICRRL